LSRCADRIGLSALRFWRASPTLRIWVGLAGLDIVISADNPLL